MPDDKELLDLFVVAEPQHFEIVSEWSNARRDLLRRTRSFDLQLEWPTMKIRTSFLPDEADRLTFNQGGKVHRVSAIDLDFIRASEQEFEGTAFELDGIGRLSLAMLMPHEHFDLLVSNLRSARKPKLRCSFLVQCLRDPAEYRLSEPDWPSYAHFPDGRFKCELDSLAVVESS
jgi:hypothetical protein